MISGTFTDGHPRTTLALVGAAGPVSIEFIIDTGFDGDFAVPGHIARRLGGFAKGFTDRLLANGTLVKVPVYEAVVQWEREQRRAEVLVMEGNALMGSEFLRDHLLQVEMTDGGEVTAEPL